MPETHFTIRWPDGQTECCYSPSTIVYSHLDEGSSYRLDEFMARATTALHQASERVQARYGFACSSALDQLRLLEMKRQVLHEKGIDGNVVVIELTTERRSRSAKESIAEKPIEKVSVVVIGAGQAGLSMSYLLKARGIAHVVLEKHRVGHAWRNERWDSFCLVTPNWQCRLPGYDYTGDDPQGFMKKDSIVEFLEDYAQSFHPPLREGITVERLTRSDDGYLLETTRGRILAEQVVVATGGYHIPKVPSFAAKLPSTIRQIHSRDYKNPAQLPEGEILVVGSGQSGCQIVEDLMLASRTVHLSVGDAPRCARRYRGRDVVEWLEMMGHYGVPIEKMPDPEAARTKTNHYVTGRDGGHDIDLREFAQRGLRLYGSAIDYEDHRLVFAPNLRSCLDAADDTYRRINRSIDDFIAQRGMACEAGTEYEPVGPPPREADPLDLLGSNITSIIWSIGFQAAYRWLQVGVISEKGLPIHQRGITKSPGLYFLGLPWLHTWGSGRFCGVAKDAEFLLEQIEAHRNQRIDCAV